MRDVARALHNGVSLPYKAVAVTVDDGYRDFLNGYEVFRRYGIPVTVYLPTDFLDRRGWLWWDLLRYMIDNTRMNCVELSFGSTNRLRLDLADCSKRRQIFERLKLWAKHARNDERLLLLQDLRRLLQIEPPAEPPEQDAPLSWHEVRALHGRGVEFGAHTKSHPILSRVSENAAMDEIRGSKKRLEEELQSPVIHFCYPNGRLEDIGSFAVEDVKKAGFYTAVTTEYGFNTVHSNMFLLKRIGVEPEMPPYWFEEVLCLFRMRAKGYAFTAMPPAQVPVSEGALDDVTR
jgi:peptidoglycan/xylan/chitin deacetylase (PgdA/CDA1 family)